jgi:hypothetical protein
MQDNGAQDRGTTAQGDGTRTNSLQTVTRINQTISANPPRWCGRDGALTAVATYRGVGR